MCPHQQQKLLVCKAHATSRVAEPVAELSVHVIKVRFACVRSLHAGCVQVHADVRTLAVFAHVDAGMHNRVVSPEDRTSVVAHLDGMH